MSEFSVGKEYEPGELGQKLCKQSSTKHWSARTSVTDKNMTLRANGKQTLNHAAICRHLTVVLLQEVRFAADTPTSAALCGPRGPHDKAVSRHS